MGIVPGYVDPGVECLMLERQQRNWERRKLGWSYEEIGKAEGCSTATAFRDIETVMALIREATLASVITYRELTGYWLLEQIRIWKPIADKADSVKAADHYRKLLAQYAELWGANVPVKQQIDIGVSREEIAALPDDELLKLLPP